MSRDLRQFAKQTNIRLITGFILLLFLIGDGLILYFYGKGAAIMGIICIIAALLPVVLIILALWMIDWIARRNDPG